MDPGPELDRAVAAALGLCPPRCPFCDERHWGRLGLCNAMPEGPRCAYSTNPARIEEMLSWLRSDRPRRVEVRVEIAGHVAAETYAGRVCYVEGDTIQHALALLVVAVAETQ